MLKSNLSRKPTNKTRTKYFALKGGLNLFDAPLTIPEGQSTIATNFELLTREGYRRLEGFERYDGQPLSSEASYWILNYNGGIASISEGNIVMGALSGETGKALIDQVGTVASGFLVLTNVTGAFIDNENLQVLAVTKCIANGQESKRGAGNAADDTTYLRDAIETQRLTILKVGVSDGTGVVRGVHRYKGSDYAFRDNSGATQCLMWKATITGWVQQSLGNRIHFTDAGAGVAYVEGEAITGTISTATAVILRIVLQSGAWGTDAKGYFIVGVVTGGPFQAEATTGNIAGAVPIDAAEIANTMAAGGRYEFENYNFFASTITQRMYGVNGVSEAFEWDGSVFVPIITGNIIDKPNHLAVNEYHLQLSFNNGSLQNSATALPYVWAGGGAAEIGTGDDIIGLKKEVGGALIIICKNRTFALHGKNTVASPWDLKTLSEEAGGKEWTLQRLGSTKYLDDRGFMDIKAVLDFGDFNTSTYSQLIEPLVNIKKSLAISSIIVKSKSQIRIFFSDGTGIIATFNNNKLSGFTTINYINKSGSFVIVQCTSNGEDSSGNEVLLFGADDGYVYKMDSGNSFDGGAVTATLQVTYSNLGSPSYDKQFKKVIIEANGSNGTVIKYNVLLDYSSGRSPTGRTNIKTLTAGGSQWNTVNWNEFVWASEDVTRIENSISGVGRNIALQLASVSTYEEPYTLYGISYHYIIRKLVR